MNDFMRGLYANYITPQLKTADITGYETPLSLMDTTMDAGLREQYERAVEFYAANAFLLGIRTGVGLKMTLEP